MAWREEKGKGKGKEKGKEKEKKRVREGNKRLSLRGFAVLGALCVKASGEWEQRRRERERERERETERETVNRKLQTVILPPVAILLRQNRGKFQETQWS